MQHREDAKETVEKLVRETDPDPMTPFMSDDYDTVEELAKAGVDQAYDSGWASGMDSRVVGSRLFYGASKIMSSSVTQQDVKDVTGATLASQDYLTPFEVVVPEYPWG
jgi:hypothetical protein